MLGVALEVSICILTYSQPELLPKCVAACLSEIERARLEAEIIIIDNASRDGYPAKLAGAHPQVTVIRTEQPLGFSAGNNRAIRESRSRFVLVLNDDAVLGDCSLGLMMRALEARPDVAMVGPKLLNPDGTLQTNFTNLRASTLPTLAASVLCSPELLGRWRPTRRIFTQLKDDNQSGTADELAGACLLVRREALDAVGFFDENFFYWWEDKDLCWRMSKAGWKLLYLAEAAIVHYRSASTGKIEIIQRSVILYRSQMYFLKKHLSPVRYRLAKAVLSIAFLLRAPLVFAYRLVRKKGDVAEATTSAIASLTVARWLFSECE